MKHGRYSWYPSSVVSPYWCWFKELGYPELDLHFYEDGTFFIIQFLNSPIIPSLTKWQVVLGPMRNIIPTYAFCEKYTAELDITKRAFWAREDAKTKDVYEEAERTDRRDREFAEKATEAVMRNPGLVKRVAKNGLKETDLRYLSMHVPHYEVSKPLKGVKVDVPNSSECAVETVHAPVPGPVS